MNSATSIFWAVASCAGFVILVAVLAFGNRNK
jgi:hypothetical protein